MNDSSIGAKPQTLLKNLSVTRKEKKNYRKKFGSLEVPSTVI